MDICSYQGHVVADRYGLLVKVYIQLDPVLETLLA